MKHKKIMALILAATMVAGSSVAVLAADANSATGTGSSFDHVDREVTDVTLPTDSAVAHVFDYYIDPERVIDSAGTLTDGTDVTANADGVYFTNAGTAAVAGTAAYTSATNTGNYTVTVSDLTINATYTYDGSTDNRWEDSNGDAATPTITITDDDNNDSAVTPADGDTVVVSGATAAGAASYSSSSDEVKFIGQNSVDVDVTVAATVTATDADKDIELVEDADALTAATTPALLMTLKVGSDTKVITSDGATAKATIQGVADNFEVKADTSNNKFVFGPKASVDPTTWKTTTVQLVGKTNQKDIPAGANAMTVPQITLTWTIAKHENGPQLTMSNAGLITMSNLTADKNYDSMTITNASGTYDININPAAVTWDNTGWSQDNGGILTIQLGSAWMDSISGGGRLTVTLTTTDGSTLSASIG